MVSERGRTVLCLPPYHCDLNPIELVWAQVKYHVAANNRTFKLSEVKALLLEGLDVVTPETWANCVKHTFEEENKMYQLGDLLKVCRALSALKCFAQVIGGGTYLSCLQLPVQLPGVDGDGGSAGIIDLFRFRRASESRLSGNGLGDGTMMFSKVACDEKRCFLVFRVLRRENRDNILLDDYVTG
ncbi:hypothetical protein Trydic_g12475 [Trypoxylus dichotomus]